MKPSLATSLLVTTVTAALLVRSCSAAIASEPTATWPSATDSSARSTAAPRTLSSVQALGALAAAARIGALDTAIPKATANVYLSAIDKVHVLGTLNGDRAAMRIFAAKIAADTDIAVATAGYHSIFTGYRVFAVAVPQSFYAAAIVGPLASKNTPAIDATMADLVTQISTARRSISGVSAVALSVTPEQVTADHEILAPTRASVKTATVAAEKARVDVASVEEALQ